MKRRTLKERTKKKKNNDEDLKTGFNLVLNTTAGEYKTCVHIGTDGEQFIWDSLTNSANEGLLFVVFGREGKVTLTLFSIPVIHMINTCGVVKW